MPPSNASNVTCPRRARTMSTLPTFPERQRQATWAGLATLWHRSPPLLRVVLQRGRCALHPALPFGRGDPDASENGDDERIDLFHASPVRRPPTIAPGSAPAL